MNENNDYSQLKPIDIVTQFVNIMTSHQFHIVRQEYLPDSFGDLLFECCSNNVCCRLIRDRGQWFIDVKGTASEEWFYLGSTKALLTGEGFDPNWQIDDQLKFIDTHLYDIEFIFKPQSIQINEVRLRKIMGE